MIDKKKVEEVLAIKLAILKVEKKMSETEFSKKFGMATPQALNTFKKNIPNNIVKFLNIMDVLGLELKDFKK